MNYPRRLSDIAKLEGKLERKRLTRAVLDQEIAALERLVEELTGTEELRAAEGDSAYRGRKS
jgi:hypothetical protein